MTRRWRGQAPQPPHAACCPRPAPAHPHAVGDCRWAPISAAVRHPSHIGTAGVTGGRQTCRRRLHSPSSMGRSVPGCQFVNRRCQRACRFVTELWRSLPAPGSRCAGRGEGSGGQQGAAAGGRPARRRRRCLPPQRVCGGRGRRLRVPRPPEAAGLGGGRAPRRPAHRSAQRGDGGGAEGDQKGADCQPRRDCGARHPRLPRAGPADRGSLLHGRQGLPARPGARRGSPPPPPPSAPLRQPQAPRRLPPLRLPGGRLPIARPPCAALALPSTPQPRPLPRGPILAATQPYPTPRLTPALPALPAACAAG